ncbi:MAG: hypothetical protein GKS05_07430 [Nitrospirales bacterium]|nr:hypothetical protein [Nitrospirales bacterium]
MTLSTPHDVAVRITCEEPATENDVESPPCLVTYTVEGQAMTWHAIDRIVFSDGVTATRQGLSKPLGPGPLAQSVRFLYCYDFPLLLTAEWGQVQRLLRLLDHPDTEPSRQVKILSLFGEIHAEAAFPRIITALENPNLIQAALYALGQYGHQSRPFLLDILQSSMQPQLQAAAIHSLGQIGATTGDTSLTPLFLNILTRPETNLAVKTEIVWALGKAPDFRAFPGLAELEQTVWKMTSQDPHIQKLREAIDWSIREVRQGGHTDDY